MRKILKINFFYFTEKKELIGVIFLSFFALFLSLISTFTDIFFHAPPNTVYSFAHNYMPDYYQYLSWMKDGADGKFFITSRYSAVDFVPKPVYLFYPLLGFLSQKMGLPLVFGYTLGRIFWAGVRLLAIYFLITQIIKKPYLRLLTFFLCLFLPPFYQIFSGKLTFQNISNLDPLARNLFIPHDSATLALILFSAIFFNFYLRQKKILFLFSSALLLSIASVFNPAITSLFLLFLAGGGFLYLVKNKKFFPLLLGGIILAIFSLPILFYYQHLFATTLPFSWMFHRQKTVVVLDFKNHFLALLPFLLVGFWGFLKSFSQKDFLTNFLLSWVIISFILAPLLGRILPLSQERLFEISHFLPLAIFGGKTLESLRGIKFKIALTLLFLFILPYFVFDLKWHIKQFASPYFNIYIPITTLQAFGWLDQNTPPLSVVAAGYYTANMIPAFSHNRVFFGHDFTTYLAEEKLQELNLLFSPSTPEEEIKEILQKNKVDYWFFSPETPTIPSQLIEKLGFKLIFFNQGNQIYQVKF
ncbi:MAG: hypothetical protein ACPLKP_03405 [Microgenomates group bacterium]